MPTFVDPNKCDGCGKCVDICPSDIIHLSNITFSGRKAYNIEPNYCWECYSCVKECPQHAIDMRGYADFAPLNHKLTVLRDKERNVVSWKIKYGNDMKNVFTFPIRSTRWGLITPPQERQAPSREQFDSQLLAHEPEYLKSDRGLVTLPLTAWDWSLWVGPFDTLSIVAIHGFAGACENKCSRKFTFAESRLPRHDL